MVPCGLQATISVSLFTKTGKTLCKTPCCRLQKKSHFYFFRSINLSKSNKNGPRLSEKCPPQNSKRFCPSRSISCANRYPVAVEAADCETRSRCYCPAKAARTIPAWWYLVVGEETPPAKIRPAGRIFFLGARRWRMMGAFSTMRRSYCCARRSTPPNPNYLPTDERTLSRPGPATGPALCRLHGRGRTPAGQDLGDQREHARADPFRGPRPHPG